MGVAEGAVVVRERILQGDYQEAGVPDLIGGWLPMIVNLGFEVDLSRSHSY